MEGLIGYLLHPYMVYMTLKIAYILLIQVKQTISCFAQFFALSTLFVYSHVKSFR